MQNWIIIFLVATLIIDVFVFVIYIQKKKANAYKRLILPYPIEPIKPYRQPATNYPNN